MKWRKLAALCLSLSMMVTTLTACGGGSAGGIVGPGGDITESGETFAQQVNDLLETAGYKDGVVQSVKLDSAVKEYADEGHDYNKDTIPLEMRTKLDWSSGLPEAGDIATTGVVDTILETDLVAGKPNLGTTINEAVLAKFGEINSPAKVAAYEIANQIAMIGEQQRYTILEWNASWAKAEPEEGEPYWIIVVQVKVEVSAEG